MTGVAVVTGGSSGMGAACVRRYRAEGFAVASLDLAPTDEPDVLAIALELGPRLRVNALAPGWVDTPGTRSNERLAAAIPRIPLRRAASPEEMADLVFLLAGEERALYVTGETVVASGGLVFR